MLDAPLPAQDPSLTVKEATSGAESAGDESTATILVAIAVNVLIALSKAVAAAFTGSAAMLSEAIHSSVDAVNEALLFVGVSRSKRPADESHPLGHGQELYFWTLIVAVVIFGAGGSVSIFEGITRLLDPHPLQNPLWSYGVLGASIVLEGVSWVVAYRALRSRVGRTSTWQVIRESKDPTVFTVLLEDSAALVGLVIALSGTFAQQHGLLYADGLASIGIGCVLCFVAFIVIRESRGLLVGESAARSVRTGIRDILTAETTIERIDSIVTMHFGPDNILLVLAVQFAPLTSSDLATVVARLRAGIGAEYPAVRNISLGLESFPVLDANTACDTRPSVLEL